jgi:Retroviral aspartyl protease
VKPRQRMWSQVLAWTTSDEYTPLSTENHFDVLPIEEITKDDSISLTESAENGSKTIPQPIPILQTTSLTPPITLHHSQFCQHPKWEKCVPDHYIVTSTDSTNSLELSVSLQTTNTGVVLTPTALLDLGATSQFIHSNFVEQHHLTTKSLGWPIPILNMDGSPNKAGSISKVIKVVLWYCDHSEKATFMATRLGKQDIILGLTWLHEHNPEVDWQSGDVEVKPQHSSLSVLM